MHDDANANGAVFGVKLGIEVFLERCVLKACQNMVCSLLELSFVCECVCVVSFSKEVFGLKNFLRQFQEG